MTVLRLTFSLSKIWLYAGKPEYLTLLVSAPCGDSDNAMSAGNQQERLEGNSLPESSETIRQTPNSLVMI